MQRKLNINYELNKYDYSEYMCCTSYIHTLYNEAIDSIAYWRMHKHHKCYNCHKYGHLAQHCAMICPMCNNYHPKGICMFLYNTLLKKLNWRLISKPREKAQSFIEYAKNTQIELQRVKMQNQINFKQLTLSHTNSITIEGVLKPTSVNSFTIAAAKPKASNAKPTSVLSVVTNNYYREYYYSVIRHNQDFRMEQFNKQLGLLSKEILQPTGFNKIFGVQSVRNQYERVKKDKREFAKQIEQTKREQQAASNMTITGNNKLVVGTLTTCHNVNPNIVINKNKQLIVQHLNDVKILIKKYHPLETLSSDLDHQIKLKLKKLEQLKKEEVVKVEQTKKKAKNILENKINKAEKIYHNKIKKAGLIANDIRERAQQKMQDFINKKKLYYENVEKDGYVDKIERDKYEKFINQPKYQDPKFNEAFNKYFKHIKNLDEYESNQQRLQQFLNDQC